MKIGDSYELKSVLSFDEKSSEENKDLKAKPFLSGEEKLFYITALVVVPLLTILLITIGELIHNYKIVIAGGVVGATPPVFNLFQKIKFDSKKS